MDFKSTQFNTVVEGALVLAVGNPKWEKAIQRAADGLKNGSIVVTELASGALVTTTRGSYRVGRGCECEAAEFGHKECKHRAARRLCALYSDALMAEECDAAKLSEEIETAIEYDRTGVSYKVVRCNGWSV